MQLKHILIAASALAALATAAQAQPYHGGFHRHGGFCGPAGCPPAYWNMPLYDGPVWYGGRWSRGPHYSRRWHGRPQYWLDGGWRFDGWQGPRPPEWREGRYDAPPPPLPEGRDRPYRATTHGDETDYDVPGDILFALDSSMVTPRAQDVIADIAGEAANRRNALVEVDGYTDTSGDHAHNQALSDARARAVAGVLQDNGIDRGRIRTRGFGETDLAVPTADDVREAQNRRVVIRVIGR